MTLIHTNNINELTLGDFDILTNSYFDILQIQSINNEGYIITFPNISIINGPIFNVSIPNITFPNEQIIGIMDMNGTFLAFELLTEIQFDEWDSPDDIGAWI